MIITMPQTADIFETEAEAIVNPVNCVGIMGAGLAKEFRERFPEMFQAYRMEVGLRKMKLGRCHAYRLPPPEDGEKRPYLRYIINFPTKFHWRDRSEMGTIGLGLMHLSKIIQERAIGSIAVPALGCSLGGLAWEPVFELLSERFYSTECEVELYPPQSACQENIKSAIDS